MSRSTSTRREPFAFELDARSGVPVYRQLIDQVNSAIAAGRLKPHIHATYRLEEIREAIGVLDRREAVGKVVLTL